MRTIVLYAIANGWMRHDPYVSFEKTEKPTTPVFLIQPEIEKIMSQEFVTRRLNVAKDAFLFCCFTGLAFSDIKTLEKSHLQNDANKQQWIRKDRVKTKIRFNVPLVDIPMLLLEKYEDDPICKKTGKLFPIPSNQKMNEYLKEIAAICGIDKHLSTHLARHTFATLSLTQNVSMHVVSQMLKP